MNSHTEPAFKPPPPGVYVLLPTFFLPTKASSSAHPRPAPIDISTQLSHRVFLAKSGIRGLVLLGSTGEAIYRVTGMGTLVGSRLPLKWNMGEGEWAKWSICMGRMEKLEDSLA